LEENKISDYYLAEAIYSLTTYFDPVKNEWVFVDYKSLGVKQLGSIYEGLLEFHLRIADQELAVVKEKGKEKYVPVDNISRGQRDTGERVKPGEIYLENSKAERKATGLYYTPDYIVSYIVENTVGPLIGEIEAQFEARKQELKTSPKYKDQSAKWKTVALKEYDPALKALGLKICDPTMGSGHFLVSTVDYISGRIFDLLTKYSGQAYFGREIYESPLFQQIQDIRQNILGEMDRQQVTIDKEKLEDDKVIIRRMVMKRCIFGVDLNYLAVELAKLSLWLNSFTVGAPLSFLDHHLRWGNSLIGSTIDEVQEEMQKSLFGSRFYGLLSATDAMIKIGELTDSTFAELQESQRDYEQAVSLLAPYKKVLDIWTSQYFGNSGAKDLIDQGKVDPDNLEASLKELTKNELAIVERAEQLKKEKRFFHWELEFPEVYYGSTGKKNNPGFDAVIGNPPYQRIQGLKATDPLQVRFYSQKYKSATGNYDIYVLMAEQGYQLLKDEGTLGFIQPHKVFQAGFGEGFRSFISQNRCLKRIVHFNANQVFPEATTYTCLLFLSGQPSESYELALIPALANVNEELPKCLAGKLTLAIKSTSALTAEPWILTESVAEDVIKKISMSNQPLSLFIDKMFQGLATSADKIYFLDMVDTQNSLVTAFSTQLGKNVKLERAILKPVLKGEDVHRYEPARPTKWVVFPYDLSSGQPRLYTEHELTNKFPNTWKYLKENEAALRARENYRMDAPSWWAYIYPKNLMQFDNPKIITPEISYGSNMTFDDIGVAHTTTVYGFVFKKSEYKDYYWLAVLNSNLLWFFLKSTGYVLHGGYFRFKTDYLSPFPVRRISFITPLAERQHRLQEIKFLVSDYLYSSNWNQLLIFIGELLEKKHNPDPKLVEKHNNNPINKDFQIPENALWEQSDVVHDFLAFLAEQMIEKNKQKQEEIKGFLKYLERTIGIDIESLQNKTLIREYHEHSFEEVLSVLERNRNRLRGFNPRSRTDQERLEREFNKSVEKLTPLKTKIQSTDKLIDQIVYKLYGLTDEEIAVVEG